MPLLKIKTTYALTVACHLSSFAVRSAWCHWQLHTTGSPCTVVVHPFLILLSRLDPVDAPGGCSRQCSQPCSLCSLMFPMWPQLPQCTGRLLGLLSPHGSPAPGRFHSRILFTMVRMERTNERMWGKLSSR